MPNLLAITSFTYKQSYPPYILLAFNLRLIEKTIFIFYILVKNNKLYSHGKYAFYLNFFTKF